MDDDNGLSLQMEVQKIHQIWTKHRDGIVQLQDCERSKNEYFHIP